MEKELGNQVTITTEFGREIPKQIGDYAQTKEIELLAQGNIEEAQKWAEGGVYRVALHTAMSALATGTVEGAFTTGGVAAAAPQIEKLEAILTEKLANDDSPESKHKAGQAAKAIISTALLTLGETSGLDASSTMMATNVEVNNRWLHNNEIEKIFGKDGAKLKQFAKEQDISYEEAWRAVLAQAYRNGDDNFREAHQTSATAKEKRLSEAAENFLRRNGFHIVATPQERANSQQNINNTTYKALLNNVISNTPKQTQQQVRNTVLTQTAQTSIVGIAKGIGNIPSDTANSIANVFHKEVPQTFPYSNEEEANVGGVAQNAVGVATIGLTPKLPNSRVVNTYGPMNQQGPLPLSVANTFRSGTYVEIVTNKPLTLYRVYGGNASKLGSYWTTTKPSGPVQSIIDSALNPAWGNPATNVVKIEVPPNTRLYQGFAANQEGLVGGGVQVVFPKDVEIKTDWIKE